MMQFEFDKKDLCDNFNQTKLFRIDLGSKRINRPGVSILIKQEKVISLWFILRKVNISSGVKKFCRGIYLSQRFSCPTAENLYHS